MASVPRKTSPRKPNTTDQMKMKTSSTRFNFEEEQIRRRFEATLIEERSRLKSRLDQVESEHQSLLGNVRRLQGSIISMQENTIRVVGEKTATAEKWHEEAVRLFQSNTILTEESESIKIQADEYKKENEILDQEVIKLKNDLKHERFQTEQLDDQLRHTEKYSKETLTVRDTLLEELEIRKNENESLSQKLSDTNQELATKVAQNEKLVNQLQDTQAEHGRNSEEHSASMTSLRTLVTELTSQRDELKSTLENYVEKLGVSEQSLSQSKKAFGELKEINDNTNNDLKDAEKEIRNLNKNSSEQYKKLCKCEEELRLLQRNFDEKSDDFKSLTLSHEALLTSSTTCKENLQNSRTKLAETDDALCRVKDELMTSQYALTRVEKLKVDYEGKLIQTENELDSIRSERDGYKKDLSELSHLHGLLNSALSDTESKFDQHRREAADKQEAARVEAATIADRLSREEEALAHTSEKLKETNSLLAQTSNTLQEAEAEVIAAQEAAQKKRMASLYRKCFGGGKALAKAWRTWTARAKEASLELKALVRLKEEKEAVARLADEEIKRQKLVYEECETRAMLARQKEKELERETRLKAEKETKLQHEEVVGKIEQKKNMLENVLESAAKVRITVAVRRLISHKKLRKGILRWKLFTVAEMYALDAMRSTEKRMNAMREESESIFANETAMEISAIRRKHRDEIEELQHKQNSTLTTMDRQIRAMREEFSLTEKNLKAERDEAEKKLSAERQNTQRLNEDLAEREADLIAQRARTSEVTASVGEIQKRLGNLALNPAAGLEGMASPSRELHRRNSLRESSSSDVTGGFSAPSPSRRSSFVESDSGGYGRRNSFVERDSGGGGGYGRRSSMVESGSPSMVSSPNTRRYSYQLARAGSVKETDIQPGDYDER